MKVVEKIVPLEKIVGEVGEKQNSNGQLLALIPELSLMRDFASDRPDVLVIKCGSASSGDEEIRQAGRAVSSAVGKLLRQDAVGSIERDVTEVAVAAGRPARFSELATAAPMHTDGMHMPDQPVPRYFSLTCLHSAKNGGELAFIDVADVMERFGDHKEASSVLGREFFFHTKGVDGEGRLSVKRQVLGLSSDGRPIITYAREYIDLGHALDGNTDLSLQETAVLDELDILLDSSNLHVQYKLERGDIALIDNARILHSRTAFTSDLDGPARLMMRLWIDPRDGSH